MNNTKPMFSLAFYENGTINYSTFDDNQCCSSKHIDQVKMIDALMDSRENEEYVYRIGDIPRHYHEAFIKNDTTFCLVQYLPKGQYPFITTKKAIKLWYPDLLFFWMVKRSALKESYVFALDGPINELSTIYHYPFSNVYPHGQICWGTNTFGNFNNLKSLEDMPYNFFTAPSNMDLVNADYYDHILKKAEKGIFDLKRKDGLATYKNYVKMYIKKFL